MKFPRVVLIVAFVLLAAAGVRAEVANTYEINAEPVHGISSNVAVDIAGHHLDSTSVWLGTSKGVSLSFDAGLQWLVYNDANGLPSDNVSALFAIGDRMWVGSSHAEFIAGELMSLSDGLTYSDDNGNTWTQINFGPGGLNIPYVWGGDRIVYDITGHLSPGFLDNRAFDTDANWLFFAAFAGGLLASQDGGQSWRRIFPSPADSVQFNLTTEAPSYRNRYFSCAVDTSHGDSLYVWTGTAGGIFQYVYIPPSQKLFSRQINGFAFCDTCSTEKGSRLFVAGDHGVSISTASPGNFTSSFVRDGLPGQFISAITSIGDYLLVGTEDTTSGLSEGLAMSTDYGETFTSVAVSSPDIGGIGERILAFQTVGSRLYMAAENAGLWVSPDSGRTWSSVLVDSADVMSPHNSVYSLSILEDTLLVGTDTGLAEIVLDTDGTVLDRRFTDFEDTDASSARIIQLRPQYFFTDSTMTDIDSTILWTVNRDASGSGTSMVGRRGFLRNVVSADTTVDTTVDTTSAPPDTTIDTLIDTLVLDSAYSWNYFQVGINTYDVNFLGDSAFVVGDSGIFFTTRGFEPVNRFSARQYQNDTLVVRTLDNDIITSMEVRADTVLFGTLNALAISNARGKSFRIYRPDLDTLGADFVLPYTTISTLLGLTGDFVPAIGVQHVDGAPSRIWASGRPVNLGYPGISVGEYKTITNSEGDSVGFDIRWEPVNLDVFAWNFAFFHDSVFAATNDGLLMHDGTRDDSGLFVLQWDTIPLRDGTDGENLIEPGTPVYGVDVVDSFLWVGTNDGTVRIKLDDFGNQRLYQKVDSTTSANEVYAYPVPFSPSRGEKADFHFVVKKAGNVTLEVYDFAMNLVARPIDNVYYDAGIYPTGSSQGAMWDGYNGNGDRVAVGIYYFKVQVGNGETRWGKLAVIP